MIGILIATKAEANHFLKYLTPLKKDGIYHFRGNISGVSTALYLTRPGVASPGALRRFLKLYAFDRVIATGTCASLTAELEQFEVVRISEVVAPGEGIIVISQSGLRAVSVTHLVTSDQAKADMRAQTGADVLDMESYTIAKILAEKEFAQIPFEIRRIVDDLPGEESYLRKEKMLREMTSCTPSGKPGFRDIWRFGTWDYFSIIRRRHLLARKIFAACAKIA